MAILVTPETTQPSPRVTAEPVSPRPGGGRIAGIDIARAIALIGMFTVHVTVFDESGESLGGVAGWWLSAPSGRASVLFMMLAGTSLSLIHRRGAASAAPAAVRRRGLVLLGGGLLLSMTVWPASILEHYGMLFLLAPWLLRLRTKTLGVVTGVALVAGPVLNLWSPTVDPTAVAEGPVSSWALGTLSSLWLKGTYPLIVWFGVFCVGLLLGRVDLGSRKNAVGLIALGVASIAAANLVVVGFAAAGIEPEEPGYGIDGSAFEDDFDFESDLDVFGASITGPAAPPSALLSAEAHSGRTAWVVESLGIASVILGAALLTRGRAVRLLRPLALLGSMSLTAYLVHIYLVSDVFDAYISESALSLWAKFAALVALQFSLVVMAVLIRLRWKQGPFEWLLKQLTGRPS